jgi:hypothetical protein
VLQPWQLSLLSFVGTSAALCASICYGVLFRTVSARAAFRLTAAFSAAASVSQVLAVKGAYQVRRRPSALRRPTHRFRSAPGVLTPTPGTRSTHPYSLEYGLRYRRTHGGLTAMCCAVSCRHTATPRPKAARHSDPCALAGASQLQCCAILSTQATTHKPPTHRSRFSEYSRTISSRPDPPWHLRCLTGPARP